MFAILPRAVAVLVATVFFFGLASARPHQARAQTTNLATTNTPTTIATGSTFQQLFAAIPVGTNSRRSITIQNNNINGDNCWVFIGPTASATKPTAILLGQGGSYQRYYPYVPSDNIAVTCTTTSDTLYVDTQ